jgi:hypothetical protein
MFVAVLAVDGIRNGVFSYRTADRELLEIDQVIDRDRLRRLTVGQDCAGDGAFSLWIINRISPDVQALFNYEVARLGRIGQRVCLTVTQLGLGVFETPAVSDSDLFTLLKLEPAEEHVAYFLTIGATT